MFSFFSRKTNFKSRQPSTCSLSEPMGVAIVATMTAIEQRLERATHWTREARNVLNKDELDKSIGLLHIAKEYAEEVANLMESVSILHDMTLTGE